MSFKKWNKPVFQAYFFPIGQQTPQIFLLPQVVTLKSREVNDLFVCGKWNSPHTGLC